MAHELEVWLFADKVGTFKATRYACTRRISARHSAWCQK